MVEDQVRAELPPDVMDVGEAEKEIVGAGVGGGATQLASATHLPKVPV